MRRIAVVGCGGSGKTVLANRLGAALGIPVTHLDAVYYDESWEPLSQEEFAERQRSILAAQVWIADGNYASTLPIRLAAADTVIFLDPPALACLWGIARRRWRYRGGQHDQAGVYDRITWGYIKYVWRYRKDMAPRVRALIGEHAGHAHVVMLRSRRAVDRFCADLSAQTPPARDTCRSGVTAHDPGEVRHAKKRGGGTSVSCFPASAAGADKGPCAAAGRAPLDCGAHSLARHDDAPSGTD